MNDFSPTSPSTEGCIAREKSLLYLQKIDDSRYKDAVSQCKIDLGIATIDDETAIKQECLTFGSQINS